MWEGLPLTGPSEGRGWCRACAAGCSPGVLRLVARQPRMSLLISRDPMYPTVQGDFHSSDPWQLVDLPGLLRGFATIPGFIAQFKKVSFMTPLPAVKSGQEDSFGCSAGFSKDLKHLVERSWSWSLYSMNLKCSLCWGTEMKKIRLNKIKYSWENACK